MQLKRGIWCFIVLFLAFSIFSKLALATTPYFESVAMGYGSFPLFYSGFYMDPIQFYMVSPYWIDAIFLVVLFVLLFKELFRKTKVLGEEGGSRVGGLIGLMAGMSLSIWLNYSGLHLFLELGPFVLIGLIIVGIISIYKWFKTQDKKFPFGLLALLFLLLLIALLYIYPSLGYYIPFSNILIAILFIIALFYLLKLLGKLGSWIISLFGGGKEGTNIETKGITRKGPKDNGDYVTSNTGDKGPSKGRPDREEPSTPSTPSVKIPKISKLEIIIHPPMPDDIYRANSEGVVNLTLYANLFEKGSLKGQNGEYLFNWVIGRVPQANKHDFSISVSINETANSKREVPIVVTAFHQASGVSKTATRIITIISDKPKIAITEPRENIEVMQEQIINLKCFLETGGDDSIASNKVGWYLLPENITNINQNTLVNKIGSKLNFNYKIKATPGKYTLVAVILNKSFLDSVWIYPKTGNIIFDSKKLEVKPKSSVPEDKKIDPKKLAVRVSNN